jgi:hypothetical protein
LLLCSACLLLHCWIRPKPADVGHGVCGECFKSGLVFR